MKMDERRRRGRLAILLRDRCSQKACPNGVINADFQGGPSDRIVNVDSRADCVNLGGGNSCDNHRCYFHALRPANWSSGLDLYRRLSRFRPSMIADRTNERTGGWSDDVGLRQASERVYRIGNTVCITPGSRCAIVHDSFDRDEFRNHGVRDDEHVYSETFMQSNPNKYATM